MTLRVLAKAVWDYSILLLGVLILAVMCFVWALVALLLNMVMPAHTARRIGRGGAMHGFRSYLAIMEALGAWRLDLEELDSLRDAGPLIIAPNHPCLLDAVLVVSRLPNTVCVMKRALLANFLLGPAARCARYVRNDSLIKLVARAGEELRLGGQLLIFPEGTRSSAEPVGPFTDAVGALSRRCGVPVQAVIIENSSQFLGKGWSVLSRPDLPLAYSIRLGRRFEPPGDVRAFTGELERYFTRELSSRSPASSMPRAAQPAVEEAHRIRG